MWPYLLGAAAILFFVTRDKKVRVFKVVDGVQVVNDEYPVTQEEGERVAAAMATYRHAGGPLLVADGVLKGAVQVSSTLGDKAVSAPEQAQKEKAFLDALRLAKETFPGKEIFGISLISDLEGLFYGNSPARLDGYYASEAIVRVACAPGSPYVATPLG